MPQLRLASMVARANIPSRSRGCALQRDPRAAELRLLVDRSGHQPDAPRQLAAIGQLNARALSGSKLRHVDARDLGLELDLVVDRDAEQRFAGRTGEAVAPMAAVLRVTTTGRRRLQCGRLERHSPGYGASAARGLTGGHPVALAGQDFGHLVTREPRRSRRPRARATRKPVTRMAAEKHAFTARTTMTCAAGSESGSAACARRPRDSKALIADNGGGNRGNEKLHLLDPEISRSIHRWRRYRSSRTTRNPLAEYRTSKSYLKREADRRYRDWLSNAPPRRTRRRHWPVDPGRPVRRRAAIIVVPAILDPFGRIARGVEQTERIGLERADRHRFRRFAGLALRAIGLARPRSPTPPIGACPFRRARHIPIRLRTAADRSCPVFWDSQVANALASIQLTLITGPLAASPIPIARAMFAAACVDAADPIRRMSSRGGRWQGLRDRHAVNRVLVFGGRAHIERAGGNDHEFGAIRTVAETISGPRPGAGRRLRLRQRRRRWRWRRRWRLPLRARLRRRGGGGGAGAGAGVELAAAEPAGLPADERGSSFPDATGRNRNPRTETTRPTAPARCWTRATRRSARD